MAVSNTSNVHDLGVAEDAANPLFSFDPIKANDCAKAIALVLQRAHTLGQGLSLAVTDPRLPRYGKRGEISLGVGDLRRLAHCDDEAIHTGMKLLMRGRIVRWHQEPGPRAEAKWWVPTVTEAWKTSADNPPELNIGSVSATRKSAQAENRYHACTSLEESDHQIQETPRTIISAPGKYEASAPVANSSMKAPNIAGSIAGTSTKGSEGGNAFTDDVANVPEDRSWVLAKTLLREAGVTKGQEEAVLRRMHSTLRKFPADLVVRAAIQEIGSREKSAGLLRTAIEQGYERVLTRAKNLTAEKVPGNNLEGKHTSRLATETTSTELTPTQLERSSSVKIQACQSLTKPQVIQAAPNKEELEAALPWERIRNSISKLMPENSFREWIEPLRPLRLSADGRILIIQAPCSSVKLWLEQQLDAEFEEAFVDAGLVGTHIEFEGVSRLMQP